MKRSSSSRLSLQHPAARVRISSSCGSSTSTRSNSRDRCSMDSMRSSTGRTPLKGLQPKSYSKSKLSYGGHTAANSRSSMYGRSKSDAMKDPRHLSDRSFKELNIRRLIEFLSEKGYTQKLSVKILHSPTTKDFLNIIEFMLKIVDAKFRLDSKHEEQIPRLLKDLGYPFLISKNMLFTVGAPHVWPHLLGALSWLVDYIESSFQFDIYKMMFSRNDKFDDSETEELIRYQYFVNTYKAFMDGKDEFVEEDELYRKKLECLHDDNPMNFKSLQIENVRLKQELENLENEPDNLEYMTATRNKYQIEFKQLTDQTEELNRRKFEKDKEFSDLCIKKENIEMELVRAMQEKDEMQKIYDTQDLSQEEIKRINMSRNELSRQLRMVEEETLDFEKRKWNLEMEIGKLQEKVEKVFSSLSQVFTKVKVAAPEIATPILESLQSSGCSEMKIELRKLVEEKNSDVLKLKANSKIEKQSIQELQQLCDEQEQDIKMLENKVKRLTDELGWKKETQATEYKTILEEVDSYESQLSEARMSQTGVTDIKNSFMEKLKLGQQHLEIAAKKKKDWQEFLQKITEMLIQHKSVMEEHFNDLAQVTQMQYETELAAFRQ
ncbi:kinetochore protein NDC80 homolog [Tubulanus polymorphus]|uniref:kinetochore protein NDC80 homolog n=1 Tax=Tubulanus polymorphus TaxID=672921 RepID=UPI003DA420D4